MTGAWLMFKCRACGETFENGRAPDAEQALNIALGLQPFPSNWKGRKPSLICYHECPDDAGIGLADLVAAMPDIEVDDDF